VQAGDIYNSKVFAQALCQRFFGSDFGAERLNAVAPCPAPTAPTGVRVPGPPYFLPPFAENAMSHPAPKKPSLLVPAAMVLLVLFALSRYAGLVVKADPKAQEPQAVAERIQPVGLLELKSAAGGALRSGEEVFKGQCAACHSAGTLGAPKLGDAGAWGPRLGQGYDKLLTSALKGKGNMGPQGGGEFSDVEVGRAVVYMANQAGGKFPEPKAPAAQ
jgi:cytochrome c5